MRLTITSVALLLALPVIFGARTVAAAETVESLVKKADAKLYYPQTAGLQTLQADVQSSRLQSELQNSPDAKNVQLRFFWSAPYRHRFQLTGVPAAMSDQARELERQLAMFGDFLVPKPLHLTLANYKSTLTENDKAFVIDARTTASGEIFYARRYAIDKKSLLPTQWRLSSSEWDADVEAQFRPLDPAQPDKFIPVEIKAQSGDTKVTIKMSWQKVEKWTLTDNLSVSFVGGDGTDQSSNLVLSNFKLNQPIPAGLFPEKNP